MMQILRRHARQDDKPVALLQHSITPILHQSSTAVVEYSGSPPSSQLLQ
jgi:hypothetical protein